MGSTVPAACEGLRNELALPAIVAVIDVDCDAVVGRQQKNVVDCCSYCSPLLNPMTTWGSLFVSLFEVEDCGGQHEFAVLALPPARVGSGTEPTLDGRKGSLGYPALAV